MIRSVALVAAAFHSLIAITISQAAHAVDLTIVDGGFSTVYSWKTQKCNDTDIPNSSARALRLSDGRILLMAAHYNNVPLIGSDFDRLMPSCSSSTSGSESRNPSEFNDRYWVQALIPGETNTIFGLASHEFHGKRHAGSCKADPKSRVQCWYSAITATVADTSNFHFAPAPPSKRVVAASPFVFDPTLTNRSGFFVTTNAVRLDGHFYALFYTEGIAGQPAGNCLFRSTTAGVAAPWEALDSFSTESWSTFSDPWRTDQHSAKKCRIVGSGVFPQFVGSIMYLEEANAWIAVFSRRSPNGIYYALSNDLRNWQPPKKLLDTVEPWADPSGCGTYYAYPSLIDHSSTSNIFDRGNVSQSLPLFDEI